MLKRAFALTREYGMLPKGCAVLCAVSGGADSMTLLHWLSRQKGITLHAAHFDHRLRGEESAADAAFVREMCEGWGIPFHLGEGDVRGFSRANGLTIEEGARRLRYAFLEETAKTLGQNTRIATAHTADDNAETILLNLIRGTGLKGLCAIPPVRSTSSPGVAIIRPLLTTGREEILAYLEENRIGHREDSSNTDEAYARNKLRRRVTPFLRELNPKAAERMGETARQLRELDEALDREVEESLSCIRVEGNRAFLSVRALQQISEPARVRFLQSLLDRLGVGRKDFGAVHLRAVLRLKPGGHLDLPSGMGVDFGNGMLTFTKRDPHYNPREKR